MHGPKIEHQSLFLVCIKLTKHYQQLLMDVSQYASLQLKLSLAGSQLKQTSFKMCYNQPTKNCSQTIFFCHKFALIFTFDSSSSFSFLSKRSCNRWLILQPILFSCSSFPFPPLRYYSFFTGQLWALLRVWQFYYTINTIKSQNLLKN